MLIKFEVETNCVQGNTNILYVLWNFGCSWKLQKWLNTKFLEFSFLSLYFCIANLAHILMIYFYSMHNTFGGHIRFIYISLWWLINIFFFHYRAHYISKWMVLGVEFPLLLFFIDLSLPQFSLILQIQYAAVVGWLIAHVQ